jgi:hypothetical protein
MSINIRFRAAIKAARVHLVCSLLVALLAGVLVLGLWYPYPYREMSGGRELFMLVMAVDVVCGPLLTLVLFNPTKPRLELWRDLGLVALIQIGALSYGIYTAWQARPLFLALEFDRFKVVMSVDLDAAELAKLPENLRPKLWGDPRLIALRPPKSIEEKNAVLFSSVQGGRDYAERPEFYIPYDGVATNSLLRSKPISTFFQKYPEQKVTAERLALERNANLTDWRYLPVTSRQDWVALLDKKGHIQGFLKGDGF